MTTGDQRTNGMMRIAVFVDPAWVWQWHIWLVEALAAQGYQVDVCTNGTAHHIPVKLRALLRIEKWLYRQGGENASDFITIQNFEDHALISEPGGSDYDLVIDLAGNTRLSQFGCRRFRPLYDGMEGVKDLVGILLDGHAPSLSLEDSAFPKVRHFGLCAVQQPEIILRGLSNVYSRMAGLLLKSVNEIADNINTTPPDAIPDAMSGQRVNKNRRLAPLKAGRFVLGNLSAKLTNRINGLVRQNTGEDIRWGVGWRFTDGRPVRSGHELDVSHYTTRLQDDGQRFYADPFVVWHEGVHHVFVEEFPFDTQTGIISHFTIDEKGKASTPQTVLSRPYHLSYPFVFKYQQQFWMIPETSANNAIELYRAVDFPHKWSFEKTLIKDIKADDVTLLEHEGRWWIFAAISDWQSSQWDALGLFYADDLMGEWQAHQANPVLLDARSARPAGRMYHHEGALWRPAQDCSTGYGAGLSLCKVEKLDLERFEQRIMVRFAPEGKDHLIGLHTLNEDNGLEVIDFFGRL